MIRLLSSLLLVIASVFISNDAGYAVSSDARYFAIPKENMKFLGTNFNKSNKAIDEFNGYVLVKLVPFEVETLSQQMHHAKAICGGFQDIQVQMETHGISAREALEWVGRRPLNTSQFDKFEPSNPHTAKQLMTSINLERFIGALTTFSGFPDRSSRGDLGVKASQWLVDVTKKLALAHGRSEITVTSISTGGWFLQPSVLVKVPGTDSTLPGILIGGHMDTFQNNKPGADDDGSGSMTVMEIYNAILDTKVRFKRDIYFAYYAAEEYGLHGSQIIAAQFKKQNIALRAVMQFDMTGYKSPQDTQSIYFVNDYVDVNLTTFLKKITEKYLQIPAHLIGDTKCGYACSDHASWTQQGYSASFPFESSFSNYNSTIHTGADKIALITPAHALKYLLLGAVFVAETADPL
ncbi:MAG: M28 family peptidase [Oligoflexia bacterium]|nr:M28 family peptidase [Oligoflexia bacterium]